MVLVFAAIVIVVFVIDRRRQEAALAEAESSHISCVLEEVGWNISAAARVLGVDRTTVYNKIKLHGLTRG